jgi:hypothetical protein
MGQCGAAGILGSDSLEPSTDSPRSKSDEVEYLHIELERPELLAQGDMIS